MNPWHETSQNGRVRAVIGQTGVGIATALVLIGVVFATPSFAAQEFRGKKMYFGDAHWHSCLSQDAKGTTLTAQYESMLYDYGLDFSLQSEHAEAAEAGIVSCDTYLPLRTIGTPPIPIPYTGNQIATAMKQAADDWNGRIHGDSKFVTFPGYEWAPDARCWKASPTNPHPSDHQDTNANHNTPGHINYFFSDTTGWSYGPDVWEPGDGDSGTCATGTALGLTYYSGSRDWTDEILGQLIHQRDDPDRHYDMLIQYNHPAATRDKGGFSDHVAKWYDHEHSDTTCSVKPGGVPCTSQNQCETVRRAYGVTSVEWYANQEAAIGSTELHPYSPTDPQCKNTFSPPLCALLEEELHHEHHFPGRFVASRGLQEGYTLGFFGGSDSHSGRKNQPTGFPEAGSPGSRGAGGRSLTVVYADDATRPAIWDGLSHRRAYALSRFREIGPVHKGRVDFFTLDPASSGLTREIEMGEFAETSPAGSTQSFTIAAAAEEGTTGVFPRELRLYAVGINTPLSYRTDIDHYWLDDEPNDLGKLGILLGKVVNATPAAEFTHTFTNISVNPGDAVFAVVIYSDDEWVDDYYDENEGKLDEDGDGQPDPGKVPARHGNNNTWARTTPIWFYAANEQAKQTASCSTVGFAGSSYTEQGAGGASDTGFPGDAEILPVAQANGYKLEWNQWTVSVPADYQYADLSFFTEKDEDNIGHLFAIRIDGQLLYSGRAGVNHGVNTLVEKKNLFFPLKKGLHKIEVHMDDQEYTETDDNYHCNDYDGPPGYVDAIVFHNAPGDSCGDVTPPQITCPTNATVECSAAGGAPASHPTIAAFLAGASATDNVDPSPEITHNAPAFFSTGTTTVTFTATDDALNTATCTATVTVADTTPPALTSAFTLAPATLRPPNHKLGKITVPTLVAADVCDAVPLIFCSVESNEPTNGTGDGDTPSDIVFNGEVIATQGTGPRQISTNAGSGTFSLELRAERSGKGNGRAYSASCEAVDAAGLHSQARTTTVKVPR